MRTILLLFLSVSIVGCAGQPEWRRRLQLLNDHFPRPPKQRVRCLSDDLLAQGIVAAVKSVDFSAVFDQGPLYGVGCPDPLQSLCQTLSGRVGKSRHPQLDLSLIAFNPPGCAQSYAKATVVFDRSHPDGFVGQHDPKSLQIRNIRFRKWDEARWNGGQYALPTTASSAKQEDGASTNPLILPGTERTWESPYSADSLLHPEPAPSDEPSIDFLSPWPASSFKMMVATRFLKLLDDGHAQDGASVTLETPIPLLPKSLVPACPEVARTLTLQRALETMLQWSGNCATAGLVRFLHQHQEIIQSEQTDSRGFPTAPPTRNLLNEQLAGLGLHTLQMNRTMAKLGRWGSPDNNYEQLTASVANNHMTSWDTARLFWLFDELPESQRPQWEVRPGQPVWRDFVSPRHRELLREILRDSYSGTELSNNHHCPRPTYAEEHSAASPGFGQVKEPGILTRVPEKWLQNGKLRTPFADHPYPQVVDDLGPGAGERGADLLPCQQKAEVAFLHKPGLTNVAASSTGIAHGIAPFRRHYIISFFSTLGTRYGDAATPAERTESIPLLGARIDTWLAWWLE